MMDFYNRYFLAYLDATEDKRTEALAHWTRCDKKNRESGREDLWIFSTKMLYTIIMAQTVIDKFKTMNENA